jgi:hypothetical protein
VPQSDPLFVNVPITVSEKTALRAMSVSHQRVRLLVGLRLIVSAAIAISGAVVTLADLTPEWVAFAGALWAGAYAFGLFSWIEGQLNQAARLQEMFEFEFFKLPWNTVMAGAKVPTEDCSRLSARYRSHKDVTDGDWNRIPNLPRPFDVLARQQQNLGWGSRIRRRYANAVLTGVTAWIILGAVIGAVGGLSLVDTVLRWFVPSFGGLLLGIDTFRLQREVAAERERVKAYAEERVLAAAGRADDPEVIQELLALSRQLQDVLYATRCRAPRAPSWLFYQRYYQRDERDFRALVERLAAAMPPPAAGAPTQTVSAPPSQPAVAPSQPPSPD